MKAKKPAKKVAKKTLPKKKSAAKIFHKAATKFSAAVKARAQRAAVTKATKRLLESAASDKGHKVAEKNLWNWFATGVMNEAKRLHMRRIENSVSAGGSDVDLCFAGRCAIIELKAVPRAEPVDTGITTAQAMFAEARALAGGYAWILIQVGDGPRYLIPGKKAVECIGKVPEKTLRRLSVQLIDGSPLDILNAATGR